MSATTTESIAEELRADAPNGPTAIYLAAIPRFAEKITITHEPPNAADGVVDRATLAPQLQAENTALTQVMQSFDTSVTVELRGDQISSTSTMKGTLQDGTPIVVENTTIFTATDGEINAIHSVMDAESGAAIMKVIAEAGFELPPS